MDTENKHLQHLSTILVGIGASCWALAGPSVVKLVQNGYPLPWWAVTLLIAGTLLFVTAILVSVIPNKVWGVLISKISPRAIRRRRKECHEYREKLQREQEQQEFLKRRLPTYIIHEPVINPQPINPTENFPQYAAKFKIEITNQPDCIEPVEVYFNARMSLKQKWGYGNLSMSFQVQPRLPNARILLGETREYEINMVGYPDGTSLPYLDLNKCYQWTIENVILNVYGLQKKVECRGEGNINEE